MWSIILILIFRERRFALKHVFVKNIKDLAVYKHEILIATNLNSHPNLIEYVDSSITLLDGGIHEVLLLMHAFLQDNGPTNDEWSTRVRI